MKVSREEYQKMAEKASPPSPFWKNAAMAFLTGGLICCAGQALVNFYQGLGMNLQTARGFVSVTLILASALLTGLRVYDNVAKHAGAGTLVPITGFANAVVSPAIEFKSEKIVTGTCAKMFTIAGPVLVMGITASILYGLILWALGLAG